MYDESFTTLWLNEIFLVSLKEKKLTFFLVISRYFFLAQRVYRIILGVNAVCT